MKDCDFAACPSDYEEIRGGPDPTIRHFVGPEDFVLDTRCLNKHRFYSNTGAAYPDVNTDFVQSDEISRAVAAARRTGSTTPIGCMHETKVNWRYLITMCSL